MLHDILDDVFDLVLRKEDVASSVVDMSQDEMLDDMSLVGSILSRRTQGGLVPGGVWGGASGVLECFR